MIAMDKTGHIALFIPRVDQSCFSVIVCRTFDRELAFTRNNQIYGKNYEAVYEQFLIVNDRVCIHRGCL